MLTMFLAVIDDAAKKDDFTRIYYKYEKIVFAIAYAILEDKYDAEDAAQEAWFAISKNISRLDTDNEEFVERYVRKAAKSHSFMIIRKKNRSPKVAYSLSQNLASENEDAESVAHNNEFSARIINCLMNMPDTYRDVLTLFYLNDLKAKAIAAILGEPLPTVKSKLQRGKKILKQTMSEGEKHD